MLAEGVHPQSLERAATQAGYPVGPLQLTDELNMELMLKIAKATADAADTRGLRLHRAPRQRRREADGRARPPVAAQGRRLLRVRRGRPRAPASGRASPTEYPAAADPIPFQDVKDRMLFAEALETAKCFEEGVITSSAAANIGSIMGIGFPPNTGGAAQFMTGYESASGEIGLAAFVAARGRARRGVRRPLPAHRPAAGDGREGRVLPGVAVPRDNGRRGRGRGRGGAPRAGDPARRRRLPEGRRRPGGRGPRGRGDVDGAGPDARGPVAPAARARARRAPRVGARPARRALDRDAGRVGRGGCRRTGAARRAAAVVGRRQPGGEGGEPRQRVRVAPGERRPSRRPGHAQPPRRRGCAPVVDPGVHARRPAGRPRVRRGRRGHRRARLVGGGAGRCAVRPRQPDPRAPGAPRRRASPVTAPTSTSTRSAGGGRCGA